MKPTVPANILATTLPEATAQISATLALAALQSLAVDLRAIREVLEDFSDDRTSDGPESLASFICSSVEGVLVDNIEPAMQTLARAATATLEDLKREWAEQQEHQEPPPSQLA